MTTISRYRGDTKPDRFTINKADKTGPLDLTGAQVIMTVNKRQAPLNAADQVAQIVGNIIDGPAGVVDFRWDSTKADQTPGTYYYDVQITETDGSITTITLDKYVFKQDITK